MTDLKTMPRKMFERLGGGEIAYIRPLMSEEVPSLFPDAPELAPGMRLWALLNADGSDEFILALCRLACAGSLPEVSTACDQSLIFVSGAKGYQSLKMPGELLDIRRAPGAPTRLLSSSISDRVACPVADGVCNSLYEIRNGELVQAGIE
jgi:hypothetical protein